MRVVVNGTAKEIAALVVEQLSKALNRVSELESELHWATIGMSMTLESGNEKEVD